MVDTESLVAGLREIRDSINALLDKASDDSEKPERKIPPLIAQRLADDVCIFCGERPQESRGLCSAHYQAIYRMVRDGKLTDAEAVARPRTAHAHTRQ